MQLGQATMLVLPSLEGNLPMVILEAMASGVPVAASCVGCVSDIVNDKTGRLFIPSDADSIRTAVNSILSNPDLSLKLARNARQRVTDYHLPELIAKQHIDVYKKVIHQRETA